MAKMKVFSECVAMLVDVVGSRSSARQELHRATLVAVDDVNAHVAHLDPLRVTVGDELQGVYRSLGEALTASWWLRLTLTGTADLRVGLGGGQVRVIDAERGIQDGTAWWLAREAIDGVEELAEETGYGSARTAIRDDRSHATPAADALVRLVDAHLGRLRDGSRRSLHGLLAGLDNAAVAEREGITASANSQRVSRGDLRILADSMTALGRLP